VVYLACLFDYLFDFYTKKQKTMQEKGGKLVGDYAVPPPR